MGGWWRLSVYALVIAAACVVCNSPSQQAPLWTVPYLSGAANIRAGGGWLYDAAAVGPFTALAPEARAGVRFERRPVGDLVENHYNAPFFVFVVLVARWLFFPFGDLAAVELLQCAVHIGMSLAVISLLGTPRRQLLFLVFYALNPLVLWYVTFPYYYFWQVVPAFILLLYLMREGQRGGAAASLAGFALAGSFLLRPSTLPLVCLAGVVVVVRSGKRAWLWLGIGALGPFMLLQIWGFQGTRSGFWHTAYVGIAAYPNQMVHGLSDVSGWREFRDQAGLRGRVNGLAQIFEDEGLAARYSAWCRERVLTFVRRWPLLAVRNGALNLMASFGLGYFVGLPAVTAVSIGFGAAFLATLMLRRMYLMAVAIGFSAAGFAAVYPPIPAYMFGGYLLIFTAAVVLIDGVVQHFRRGRPWQEFLVGGDVGDELRFRLVGRS